MNAKIKDYLPTENLRNRTHAALYERILQKAFGDDANCAVLIGHHLTFELDGDLNTENEIPSADTLLFDHEIMGRVFGSRAIEVMRALASVPADVRDGSLASELDKVERANESKALVESVASPSHG